MEEEIEETSLTSSLSLQELAGWASNEYDISQVLKSLPPPSPKKRQTEPSTPSAPIPLISLSSQEELMSPTSVVVETRPRTRLLPPRTLAEVKSFKIKRETTV